MPYPSQTTSAVQHYQHSTMNQPHMNSKTHLLLPSHPSLSRATSSPAASHHPSTYDMMEKEGLEEERSHEGVIEAMFPDPMAAPLNASELIPASSKLTPLFGKLCSISSIPLSDVDYWTTDMMKIEKEITEAVNNLSSHSHNLEALDVLNGIQSNHDSAVMASQLIQSLIRSAPMSDNYRRLILVTTSHLDSLIQHYRVEEARHNFHSKRQTREQQYQQVANNNMTLRLPPPSNHFKGSPRNITTNKPIPAPHTIVFPTRPHWLLSALTVVRLIMQNVLEQLACRQRESFFAHLRKRVDLSTAYQQLHNQHQQRHQHHNQHFPHSSLELRSPVSASPLPPSVFLSRSQSYDDVGSNRLLNNSNDHAIEMPMDLLNDDDNSGPHPSQDRGEDVLLSLLSVLMKGIVHLPVRSDTEALHEQLLSLFYCLLEAHDQDDCNQHMNGSPVNSNNNSPRNNDDSASSSLTASKSHQTFSAPLLQLASSSSTSIQTVGHRAQRNGKTVSKSPLPQPSKLGFRLMHSLLLHYTLRATTTTTEQQQTQQQQTEDNSKDKEPSAMTPSSSSSLLRILKKSLSPLPSISVISSLVSSPVRRALQFFFPPSPDYPFADRSALLVLWLSYQFGADGKLASNPFRLALCQMRDGMDKRGKVYQTYKPNNMLGSADNPLTMSTLNEPEQKHQLSSLSLSPVPAVSSLSFTADNSANQNSGNDINLPIHVLSFNRLYHSLAATSSKEWSSVFLFHLLHINAAFRSYVIHHPSLDSLLLPLLHVLFEQHDLTSNWIYMIINNFLVLSQEETFLKRMHEIIIIEEIPWWKNNKNDLSTTTIPTIKNISLHNLVLMVLFRLLSKSLSSNNPPDAHSYANCLATLSNMAQAPEHCQTKAISSSASISNSSSTYFHPYCAYILVDLFTTCCEQIYALLASVCAYSASGHITHMTALPSSLAAYEAIGNLCMDIIVHSLLPHNLQHHLYILYFLTQSRVAVVLTRLQELLYETGVNIFVHAVQVKQQQQHNNSKDTSNNRQEEEEDSQTEQFDLLHELAAMLERFIDDDDEDPRHHPHNNNNNNNNNNNSIHHHSNNNHKKSAHNNNKKKTANNRSHHNISEWKYIIDSVSIKKLAHNITIHLQQVFSAAASVSTGMSDQNNHNTTLTIPFPFDPLLIRGSYTYDEIESSCQYFWPLLRLFAYRQGMGKGSDRLLDAGISSLSSNISIGENHTTNTSSSTNSRNRHHHSHSNSMNYQHHQGGSSQGQDLDDSEMDRILDSFHIYEDEDIDNNNITEASSQQHEIGNTEPHHYLDAPSIPRHGLHYDANRCGPTH